MWRQPTPKAKYNKYRFPTHGPPSWSRACFLCFCYVQEYTTLKLVKKNPPIFFSFFCFSSDARTGVYWLVSWFWFQRYTRPSASHTAEPRVRVQYIKYTHTIYFLHLFVFARRKNGHFGWIILVLPDPWYTHGRATCALLWSYKHTGVTQRLVLRGCVVRTIVHSIAS